MCTITASTTYLQHLDINDVNYGRKFLIQFQGIKEDEKRRDENIRKQRLKRIEIQRHLMFYVGSNKGKSPLLSPPHLLNVLPASNFGGELLIRYIFFGQSLEWFRNKQRKLIAKQAVSTRDVRRSLQSKAKSCTLSQHSYFAKSNILSQSRSSTVPPRINRSLTQSSVPPMISSRSRSRCASRRLSRSSTLSQIPSQRSSSQSPRQFKGKKKSVDYKEYVPKRRLGMNPYDESM